RTSPPGLNTGPGKSTECAARPYSYPTPEPTHHVEFEASRISQPFWDSVPTSPGVGSWKAHRLLIPSVQRVPAAPVAKKTITASARHKGATRGRTITTASAPPVCRIPVVLAHSSTN